MSFAVFGNIWWGQHQMFELVLMAVSFVVVVGIPSIGLWGLVILLLQTPIERLLARRRGR